MIQAEVVFEDDSISINGKTIKIDHLDWLYHVYEMEVHVEMFQSLEKAIKHCLEN